MCADDFGSALKHLLALKIQYSIFKLAAPVAGLHLKSAKCVSIVSKMDLTEHLVSSIRSWLSVNVPEFINIRIADHGKYLGWYLGKEDVSRSFLPYLNSRIVCRKLLKDLPPCI